MGASNVIAAYTLYAGKVPPLSMQCLAYMAVVSKDEDPQPWYGQGHAALAAYALGRGMPVGKADVKAVERAIAPLLAIGAIKTDRRASVRRDGPHTARYRLQLDLGCGRGLLHVPHIPGDDSPQDIDESPVDNPPQGPQDPPESGPHVPRNPGPRPPDSVSTSPGIRGTEEPRGTRRSEKEEEDLVLRTEVTVRARETDADPNQDPNPPAEPDPEPRQRSPGAGYGFCNACRADGKITLAVDTETGNACAYHLRTAA